MGTVGPDYVARFLGAWFATRQVIQKANFNRFQRAGLSATQFMVLNLMPSEGDGQSIGELAKQLNLSAATVTATIDSLEARGLAIRRKSTKDKRQVTLSLTAAGRRFHNGASREFKQYISERFRRISPRLREGLVAGLEAMLAADTELTSPPTPDGDPPEMHNSRKFRRR